MANQTGQIAASQQRQAVPKEWQLVFADWANSTLQSLTGDLAVGPSIRAYARWELDYRKAFGLLMCLDPETGGIVRVETDEELAGLEAAEERIKAAGPAVLARLLGLAVSGRFRSALPE